MQTKDKCLAALVILCWGLNFVAIKWGLEGIPPLLLGALRFIGVVFPAIMLVPKPAMPWRWLLAYGGAISLGQFAFLFSAMKFGMPAGMASLVLQSQVVFTLLFAMFWLGERWQPHHWVALPLAGGGLYLIATHGEGNLTLLGFILTLCAAACWGLGNVINRQIGLRYQTTLPSLIAWGGLVPIVPFFRPILAVRRAGADGQQPAQLQLAGIAVRALSLVCRDLARLRPVGTTADALSGGAGGAALPADPLCWYGGGRPAAR